MAYDNKTEIQYPEFHHFEFKTDISTQGAYPYFRISVLNGFIPVSPGSFHYFHSYKDSKLFRKCKPSVPLSFVRLRYCLRVYQEAKKPILVYSCTLSEDNKKNVESPFNEFGTDLRDFRFSLYTNFILYSTPGWEIKTPAGSSKHKQSVKFMIRLGYVAINTGLATASSTFRLKNYSDELMVKTAQSNLDALRRILCWNIEHRIYLFRITSALIPFGSHPVNHGIWKDLLRSQFKKAGEFISANHMRVSMHPVQYTLLNTPNDVVFKRSLGSEYHCTF